MGELLLPLIAELRAAGAQLIARADLLQAQVDAEKAQADLDAQRAEAESLPSPEAEPAPAAPPPPAPAPPPPAPPPSPAPAPLPELLPVPAPPPAPAPAPPPPAAAAPVWLEVAAPPPLDPPQPAPAPAAPADPVRGRRYYEAFRAAKGGRTRTGALMAQWNEMTALYQAAFSEAAQAAAEGHSAAECYRSYLTVLQGVAWNGDPAPAWEQLADQAAWTAATEAAR